MLPRLRCWTALSALLLALSPPALADDDLAGFQKVTEGAGVGLQLQLQITRNGRTSDWLPTSTPIYDNDRVALLFTPSEAGYITLINHGTGGEWSLIYPTRPEEVLQITPGAPARVPAQGGNFPVTPPAGQEGLYLMFSAAPPGPEVAQLLAELIKSHSQPATAEPATATEPAPIVALGFRSLSSPAGATRGLLAAEYAVEDSPTATELRVHLDLDHRAGPGPDLP